MLNWTMIPTEPEPIVCLEQAWRWVCPGCHSENFAPADVLPDGEAEELLRHENDLQPWESIPEEMRDAEFVVAPVSVLCPSCRRTFVTDASADDADDSGFALPDDIG